MKPQKHVKSVVLASALASMLVMWWTCEFNKVDLGPADPSLLSTARILQELAGSRTQPQAEMAITHLIEKTGIGRPVKGGKYEDYLLSDRFIAALAAEHLQFLNGEYNWTWGKMFEVEKFLSEREWILSIEFVDAVGRLRVQANSALDNPETPNNALLVMAVAKDTTFPAEISFYDENAPISPVQAFLFEVWAHYEFGRIESAKKEKTSVVKFEFTFVECDGNKVARKIKIKHEEPSFNKKQENCLKQTLTEYEQSIKNCFRRHDKVCPDLKKCLEKAYENVQKGIKECGDLHDQGSGGY